MKKKLDSRLPKLLADAAKTDTRSLLVIVGDRGKDQIANLHMILSRSDGKRTKGKRPNVLWCYKKELGFSSHKQKRMRQIKARMRKGLHDPDTDDPFELFVSSTDIRYTYYADSHKILGQTFGMLVLSDFEALTPNLLARTIETVQGGGLIVLLLRSMNSLKALFSMAMDVHSRFRTEAHGSVVGRFNERFLLSLADCSGCLVLDDELNVLPLSGASMKATEKVDYAKEKSKKKSKKSKKSKKGSDDDGSSSGGGSSSDSDDSSGGGDGGFGGPSASREDRDLAALKESLRGTEAIGNLVSHARTLDQAKSLLVFEEAISEKTLRTTVALTAARGRGKSAALGLAMALAVSHGYSGIYVTAPSPENVATLFEFLFKGLDALEYQEHLDYEVVRSTNPDFHKAVIRVNVTRSGHRQTVQFVLPTDTGKLSQCELLVIDEAAAIPLPMVKALLGPYLVFMSSTVNGYEGTGRSLSLKLIAQLRSDSRGSGAGSTADRSMAGWEAAAGQRAREEARAEGKTDAEIEAAVAAATAHARAKQGSHHSTLKAQEAAAAAAASNTTGRKLVEITLHDPIRYARGDPVEAWLNNLLCLQSAEYLVPLAAGAPHPSECSLYYVNTETLFSYHRASEVFLQRVMALYVASHYKNSPNDLQLLSDAPAHHLFVLLGPTTDAGAGGLPDILCVVQVALEGEITRESVAANLQRGIRPTGDLIPWTVSQQFSDNGFPTLSGARIVRIATHPDHTKHGYGTQAISLLKRYYEGQFPDLSGDLDASAGKKKGKKQQDEERDGEDDDGENKLASETLKPRKNLPPLLLKLTERPAERLDWLGTSFGLTLPLVKFWSRLDFLPVYVRYEASEVTGEHTIVMLHSLNTDEDNVPAPGAEDASGKPLTQNAPWLVGYAADFRARFVELLGFTLKDLPVATAIAVAERIPRGVPRASASEHDTDAGAATSSLPAPPPTAYSALSIKRLGDYAKGLIDYHVVIDLVPSLAHDYHLGSISGFNLSAGQIAILTGIGLQRKSVNAVAAELGIQQSQVLALFSKSMVKFYRCLTGKEEEEAARELGLLGTDEPALNTAGAKGKDKDNGAKAKGEEEEGQEGKGNVGVLGSIVKKYGTGKGEWDQIGNMGKIPSTVSIKRKVDAQMSDEEDAKRKKVQQPKSAKKDKKNKH